MAATATRRLMRRKRTILLLLLMALPAILVAIVLIRQASAPNSGLAFPADEIVVGVDASFPPFASDDGTTLRGLDIDLASAIATELGLALRFENIGFYALYDALISGRVDLLISALRIDRARMDDVRYTQPYFDNGLVSARPADAANTELDSLANARIAFEYASAADAQVRAWDEDDGLIQRLPYELPEYALDALQLGLADAAIVDAITFRLFQREHPNFASQSKFITSDPYAIAVRIDRHDAWRLVENALTVLIERGEVARIIEKWL
jgi:polar amino acid transport system substrate-binding protein